MVKFRIKRIQILFYVAWTLFFLSVLLLSLEKVAVDNQIITLVLLKAMRYCAYFFCLLKLLMETYKKRQFLVILTVMIVFVLSFLGSTQTTMMLYGLVLISAVDINSRYFIRYTLLLQSLYLFFVVCFSQIGLLNDYLFGVGSERIRHGLGFSWTTTGPILFFYIILDYIYIRKEKFNLIEVVILQLINVWFYFMTDSRLAFLLSTMALFFFGYQGINKKRWRWLCKFKSLYLLAPFVMLIISIFVFTKYDGGNRVWNLLNSLLSNRLELGKNAIDIYGYSFFGKNIEWIGFSVERPTLNQAIGYNYVDSSYLQLALNYGWIFVLTVLGIYSFAIDKAEIIKDYYLVMIYMFILVFSLTEPRLMNFAFNPFPILAFCKISNPYKREINIRI